MNESEPVSRYFGDIVPGIDPELLGYVATVDESLKEAGQSDFSWVLTFDRLFADTDFVKDLREMLSTLQLAYKVPVDIEFTTNFIGTGSTYRINLVQCRPLQVKGEPRILNAPRNVPAHDILIRTLGPVIGTSRAVSIDRIVYVVPSTYGLLFMNERYAVARLIGRIVHSADRAKCPNIMLVGPGRWGTTTPALGVPVSFAEINTVSVLCEAAVMREGVVPDVSLGTHFFNDIVEADILYMAVYPSRDDNVFCTETLQNLPSCLLLIFPDEEKWEGVIRVIDTATIGDGRSIAFYANAIEQSGVCYLESAK